MACQSRDYESTESTARSPAVKLREEASPEMLPVSAQRRCCRPRHPASKARCRGARAGRGGRGCRGPSRSPGAPAPRSRSVRFSRIGPPIRAIAIRNLEFRPVVGNVKPWLTTKTYCLPIDWHPLPLRSAKRRGSPWPPLIFNGHWRRWAFPAAASVRRSRLGGPMSMSRFDRIRSTARRVIPGGPFLSALARVRRSHQLPGL